jgi:hypothetical protein
VRTFLLYRKIKFSNAENVITVGKMNFARSKNYLTIAGINSDKVNNENE